MRKTNVPENITKWFVSDIKKYLVYLSETSRLIIHTDIHSLNHAAVSNHVKWNLY